MKFFSIAYLVAVIGLNLYLFQDSNELKESMARGKEIYADFCVTCHLENGEGVPHTFPPLAQSDYLRKNRMESIKGVKYGQQGELVVNGITYNNTMAPLGLDDEEIADVMNYVMNSWGNSSDTMVTVEEVGSISK